MKLFEQYKNVTISAQPYGVAKQLIQAYQTIMNLQGNQYLGEVTLDALCHSSLDNIDASAQGIIRALYYLNRKIEATRKTITFWDAYQIRDTITNRDLLLGQLAQLPANSSIVSNLRDPFTWVDNTNTEYTIHQGDVLIKDYEERIHYIRSLNSGFYMPSSSSYSNGEVTINYVYKTAAEAAAATTFTVEKSWLGYNQQGTIAPNSQTSISDFSIKPVVKYFYEGEQVFIDQSYTASGNRYILSNPTYLTLEYEVR